MDESFDWDSLTFSLTPTETMYLTTTTANDPWMPGDLRPYGDIPMSPAAGVLNYGQGLFEGMRPTVRPRVESCSSDRRKTLVECSEVQTG